MLRMRALRGALVVLAIVAVASTGVTAPALVPTNVNANLDNMSVGDLVQVGVPDALGHCAFNFGVHGEKTFIRSWSAETDKACNLRLASLARMPFNLPDPTPGPHPAACTGSSGTSQVNVYSYYVLFGFQEHTADISHVLHFSYNGSTSCGNDRSTSCTPGYGYTNDACAASWDNAGGSVRFSVYAA